MLRVRIQSPCNLPFSLVRISICHTRNSGAFSKQSSTNARRERNAARSWQLLWQDGRTALVNSRRSARSAYCESHCSVKRWIDWRNSCNRLILVPIRFVRRLIIPPRHNVPRPSHPALRCRSCRANAIREVCAHAVLGKHRHVVRYYSAWAEDDHMVIQNEFCNGE